MGVRVPPLELDGLRKGKPMGNGTRLETGRATSFEGSTPSSSAASIRRARMPLAERSGTSLPSWKGGFNSRGALSGIG